MIKYTYSNGQVSRFALKKLDTVCEKTGKSVLVGVFCRQCPFFERMSTDIIYSRRPYVICNGHDKDDQGPDVSEIRNEIIEKIRHQALCAMDY